MPRTRPRWWRRRQAPVPAALIPVTLPSEWDTARFRAEFSVHWRLGSASPDRTAVAQNELTQWAASLSRSRSVLDAAILQSDLNASLHTGDPAAAFDPTIQHVSVRIFVSDVDWHAARERNGLLQQAQLTALRHEAHTTRLRALRDTVLRDPALMMAWLLDANTSDPGHVLQHEEKLRALAQALAPNTVNLVAVEFAKIIATFVERLERPSLKQLVASLETIMTSYEEHELAAQLPRLDEIDQTSAASREH